MSAVPWGKALVRPYPGDQSRLVDAGPGQGSVEWQALQEKKLEREERERPWTSGSP